MISLYDIFRGMVRQINYRASANKQFDQHIEARGPVHKRILPLYFDRKLVLAHIHYRVS